MKSTKPRKRRDLKDHDYAHTYAEELQDGLLATQIRLIRESRHWSQGQLAKKAGMAQERISLLESGDYSSFSLSTLRKLARAFDVGLHVVFASFVETLRRMEGRDQESMRVRTREDELSSPEPLVVVDWGVGAQPLDVTVTAPSDAANAIENRSSRSGHG